MDCIGITLCGVENRSAKFLADRRAIEIGDNANAIVANCVDPGFDLVEFRICLAVLWRRAVKPSSPLVPRQ